MNNKNIFEGMLNLSRKYPPTLWRIPFDRNDTFYQINEKLVRQYKLVSGTRLKCEIEKGKITKILSAGGIEPTEFQHRKPFTKHLAQNPTDRFDFGNSKFDALRILDMVAPMGKGTRGLIVSPPKAGKTTLLENLANQFEISYPELRVIVLLVDERPEEVTAFKMSTNALVLHSSMDQAAASHVALSNFLINHIKTEVECGNDVVILIDSLTRMGRAYNNSDRNSNSRTMSGGLGSGALELPRKLFGMARNVVDGGSCTILATILKDTGSRMDEVIFQEFKGTGNCDIILDREIAEERVFPAINLRETGTRKDELLWDMVKLDRINTMRRSLLKMNKADAIEKFNQLLRTSTDNDNLLRAP